MEDPSFQNLKAIRNKKVFMLEERFMYSTTQYFADAVEKMAKTVYPRVFSMMREKSKNCGFLAALLIVVLAVCYGNNALR